MASAIIYSELDFSFPFRIIIASSSDPSAEMKASDSDCFDVDFAAEAIRSSATAVRLVPNELRKIALPFTSFVNFIYISPQVEDQKFIKGYH